MEVPGGNGLLSAHSYSKEVKGMVILIAGASHTGKTALAQRLLEKYKYPYLSIDHLKMGLIRSGNTELTPMDEDAELTAYLWPIVREIIKTAIENKQNLIVEGCYIPFDWKKDLAEEYLKDIKKYACVIEQRLDCDITRESVIEDNERTLALAKKHNVNYVLIDDKYETDIRI